MPIYEYKCEECEKVIEFFHKGQETPVCPKCGSKNLTRLISTPARVGVDDSPKGTTCCGREERCDTPPCSDDGACKRN